MADCIICGQELKPKTVFSGYYGFMYRLFKRSKGWEKFKTCGRCRDLYEKFGDIYKVRTMRLKENQ